MEHYECDQLAADTLSVEEEIKSETGVPVSLEFFLVEKLVDEVERLCKDADLIEAIGTALWSVDVKHDVEYTAYERLLKKVFNRRLGQRQKQNAAHGKFAPFAPR